MPVGKPDLYQHNNVDLAFVDSDMVRGGVRTVATISDLTNLNVKADQLKENVSLVYVQSESQFYLLTDDQNINDISGWTVFSSVGGGNGATSLDGLTDVSISSVPVAGSVLIYDASANVFVNNTISAGAGISISNADGAVTITATGSGTGNVNVNGTPVDNQLAVWYNSNTIEGDADLTWNGTKLDVSGELAADSINISGKAPASPVNGQYLEGSRIFRTFSTQTGLTAGDVYYLGSAGWTPSRADSAITSVGLLCVASSSGNGNETVGSGVVRVSTSLTGATKGDLVYLSSTTAGAVTVTRPSSSGHIVRIVGYVMNASRNMIYFDPSHDYIQLV